MGGSVQRPQRMQLKCKHIYLQDVDGPSALTDPAGHGEFDRTALLLISYLPRQNSMCSCIHVCIYMPKGPQTSLHTVWPSCLSPAPSTATGVGEERRAETHRNSSHRHRHLRFQLWAHIQEEEPAYLVGANAAGTHRRRQRGEREELYGEERRAHVCRGE